jgi:hypothetical protein
MMGYPRVVTQRVVEAPVRLIFRELLEELIHEIESRGWFVDLKRKIIND